MVYLIVVGMCVNKPNLDNNKHFPLFPNMKGTHIVFLDALASLDFTLVSKWVGCSFEFEAFKPVYIRQKT